MNLNFKENLIQIFKYIVNVILILGFFVFYIGLNGNLLFFWIGIAILFLYYVWYLISKSKLRKSRLKIEDEVQILKKQGEKIKVNLENVKIISNSWQQEVRKTSKYEDEDFLVDIHKNFVEIKITYKGRTIDYSFYIDMDTTTLELHFALKKETFLYVDLKDKEKMYLDLEFLY